jgi:predicted Zn-ribbon and HTH transcriptional regulator
MTTKEKLIDLIRQGANGHTLMPTLRIANYLIANGVIIQTEAHWIEHKCAEEDNWLLISNYECSNCHEWKREHSDYCPDCGCKMTEVK